MNYLPIGKDDGNHNVVGNPDMELREQDRWLPIANVARLMKGTLPNTAKVSKDAKECMQECVSEFILFITSEASDKCVREKRKTINGEDILYSLHDLGFENYAEVLKIYLAKYREQQALKQERGETRVLKKLLKKQKLAAQEEEGEGDEGDERAGMGSLTYSNSPAGKDVHTGDYFQPYEGERLNGEGMAYGEYINEDSENLKENKSIDELKLEENAEMDNLGMAERSYY